MESIIEKWREFSKYEISLRRKLRFYINEKRRNIKKVSFKFWHKGYLHIVYKKNLEINIENYRNSIIKRKCFFVFLKYLQEKRKYSQKRVLAQLFYSNNLQKNIFNSLLDALTISKKFNKMSGTILSKNRFLKKKLFFSQWQQIYEKFMASNQYLFQKRKEKLFEILVKNLFEGRRLRKKADYFWMQNQNPLVRKIFILWIKLVNEKKNIQEKKNYLLFHLQQKEKKKILQRFADNVLKKGLIDLQAKNYSNFNMKVKTFNKWRKNVFVCKFLSKIEEKIKENNRTKKIEYFMDLWKKKFNFKIYKRKTNTCVINLSKKKIIEKSFKCLLSWFSFIKKKNVLTNIVAQKTKNKFCRLWILCYQLNQIISEFREKISQRLILSSFSNLKKNTRERQKKQRFKKYHIEKILKISFQRLKQKFCEKKQNKLVANSKIKKIHLLKLKRTFYKLKCFTLLKCREKEIINLMNNKRILKICRNFFYSINIDDKCRKVKNQMIETFKYKLKFKRYQKIFQIMRKFVERKVFQKQYSQKIIMLSDLKILGKVFNSLKLIIKKSLSSKIQLKGLSLEYFSNHLKKKFIKE